MDSCAVLTAFVHPYVVYCIIFRSTPAMKTYKWYLLWHQVCCCAGDLFINVAAKPVIFFPLPAGYIKGIARNYMTAKAALSLGIFLVELGTICNLHLFFYRYCAISGKSLISIRSPHITGFLIWSYCWAIINPLLTYTSTTDTFATIERWKPLYPICIYQALISIPGIFAIEKMEIFLKTFIGMIYGIISYGIWMPLVIHYCMKGIKVQAMSDNLRRMHHRFLVQLIIQASIPFVLVVIPISLLVITISCEIFGLNFINDLVWCTISLFGVSGGIVLIIMNPSYHSWLVKYLPYRKTTITVMPSSTMGASSSRNTLSVVNLE